MGLKSTLNGDAAIIVNALTALSRVTSLHKRSMNSGKQVTNSACKLRRGIINKIILYRF